MALGGTHLHSHPALAQLRVEDRLYRLFALVLTQHHMRLAAQPAPLGPGATSTLGPAGAARVRAARLRASGSSRVSHPRTLDRLDCLARHL